MSTHYTYELLKQMKGQALKDTWHAMIGKPAGLKNTTGLKSTEDIIQAILNTQGNPKPQETRSIEAVEMPPKKNQRRKVAPVSLPKRDIHAVESAEIPIRCLEVKRHRVHLLHLGDQQYFVDNDTNQLFTIVEGKPGSSCGHLDRETQTIRM